jgi:hypothetical protein
MFHVPEKYRVLTGALGSDESYKNNGVFVIPGPLNKPLVVICSDGMGWEHVSVSLKIRRCPKWEEMCLIKDLFWDEEDTVIQYHPAKSKYVNCHPYVLHLWRQAGEDFPTPPSSFIGPKS